MTSEEQLKVLRMLQDGIISAADAERLLQALGAAARKEAASLPPVEQHSPRFRDVPLIAGSLLTASSATLLAVGYASGAGRGWLALGCVALGLSLFVAAVGFWLARTAWVSIRISRAEGAKPHFHFYLPLPLSLAAWVVRLAQPFVRRFDVTGLDEAILALRDGVRGRQTLTIEVAETGTGECVQVSLG